MSAPDPDWPPPELEPAVRLVVTATEDPPGSGDVRVTLQGHGLDRADAVKLLRKVARDLARRT